MKNRNDRCKTWFLSLTMFFRFGKSKKRKSIPLKPPGSLGAFHYFMICVLGVGCSIYTWYPFIVEEERKKLAAAAAQSGNFAVSLSSNHFLSVSSTFCFQSQKNEFWIQTDTNVWTVATVEEVVETSGYASFFMAYFIRNQ